MAFLQFAADSCDLEFEHEDSEDQKLILKLSLTPEKLAELHAALGEIKAKEGSELRSEFPGGWTIFWKVRSGESRFFVARPEIGQWVATLALSSTHLESIRAHLVSGPLAALSEFEPVSRMSNIEVILGARGGDSV